MAISDRPLSTWTSVLASVGDPDGTRAVGSIVALLVALGLALVMVAVWLYRSTRPDPELLAPLEVMGERRWRRGDPVWQRRRLDDLRPVGANPLAPSVAPPDIDEAFDQGPTASGFDDLHADQADHVDQADHEHETGGPTLDPPATGSAPVDAPTPEALPRPILDDLPEGDIDADALASAIAELDAELRRTPEDPDIPRLPAPGE